MNRIIGMSIGFVLTIVGGYGMYYYGKLWVKEVKANDR